MQELSYMADYWLWGMDSKGFHFTSVLLQLICVMLLFYLVRTITQSGIIALISSVIFGLHPINTEAIAYISGRSDPLYLLFILSSFLLYVKSRNPGALKKTIYYISSLILYAGSLISRETAIVFPLLLIAYGGFAREDRRIDWLSIIPFGAIVGAYAFFRLNVIEFNQAAIGVLNFNAIIFTDIKIIFNYLSLLIFPLNLHMERVMALSTTLDADAFLGLIVILPLIIFSLKLKKRSPRIFFWILWFFILLLPHLNILRLNAMYAEHWIYGAAIGIYVIIAYVIEGLYRNKKAQKAALNLLCAGIVLYLASISIARNNDWKDEPSIYTSTLKHNDSARVWSNLGVYYDINEEYAKAIEAYKEALRVSPRDTLYNNNIAIVYMKTGKMEKAVYHWGFSLKVNPNQPKVREFLSKYKI